MSSNHRIAWREGVYLLPQHFQQMERSLLSQSSHARVHRRERGFGILSLELDQDAIPEGHLIIKRLIALLPTGQVIDMPRVDPTPAPRTFSLSGQVQGLSISIALPRVREGYTYGSPDANRRDVPFIEVQTEVKDHYDSSQKHSILLYHKNVQVLIGKESLEGAETLKIAEIIRGPDGRPTQDNAFIPPTLVLSGSPALRSRLRQVAGSMRSKVAGITSERKRRVDHTLEMTPGDIQNFLYLQNLNSHLLALEHLIEDPDIHPSTVFTECLRLYGSLLPFNPTAEEQEYRYDHHAIGPSFSSLCEGISLGLATQSKTRYEVYPFKKDGEYHLAALSNLDLLKNGKFILAASANVATEEILRQLPGLLKMSDRNGVKRLVRSAVQGVEISPLNRPPAGLPVPEEAAFFRVRTSGEHWAAIVRAREGAAAASSVILPGLMLRLIGILGGDRKG